MLYRERDHQQRGEFLRKMRSLDKKTRSNKLAKIDESGFESNVSCCLGYSKKGKKILGNKDGRRRKRENL